PHAVLCVASLFLLERVGVTSLAPRGSLSATERFRSQSALAADERGRLPGNDVAQAWSSILARTCVRQRTDCRDWRSDREKWIPVSEKNHPPPTTRSEMPIQRKIHLVRDRGHELSFAARRAFPGPRVHRPPSGLSPAMTEP